MGNVADWLTIVRVGLAPAIVWSGVAGQGALAGVALLCAGLTDVLDGRVARRRRPSRHGAHLDAAADVAVLAATAVALGMLHKEIAAGFYWLIAATGLLYCASTAAGWVAHRRLVDPRQLSGKVAGGLLYVFALVTLLSGVYLAALLAAALVALAVSSTETIFRATTKIHARAKRKSTRSQAPQAANEVASRAGAAMRVTTSPMQSANDNRP